MKLAEITESSTSIPREWIETIEKIKDKKTYDYTQIDDFIIMFYGKKSIHAIANTVGVAHATIEKRIKILQELDRI